MQCICQYDPDSNPFFKKVIENIIQTINICYIRKSETWLHFNLLFPENKSVTFCSCRNLQMAQHNKSN